MINQYTPLLGLCHFIDVDLSIYAYCTQITLTLCDQEILYTYSRMKTLFLEVNYCKPYDMLVGINLPDVAVESVIFQFSGAG